jgi:succinyl-CoA synthetase beta subunit
MKIFQLFLGGVNIEEVAATNPSAIVKVTILSFFLDFNPFRISNSK